MDSSKKAVSAETIAIVVQSSGKTQGLLSSKARLAKRGLSMPRQELVSCQMGANLVTNTSNALKGLPLKENNCSTDSKVALCWLTKPFKNWKTFVANRVHKIEEITRSWNITWRYVPTDMNDGDYGTGAATAEKLHEIGWWEGPDWLFDKSNWPKQDEYFEEVRTEVHDEIKVNSDLILLSKDVKPDEWDTLLQKCSLRKTKRVTAWCLRFCYNALQQVHSHSRKSGPLKVTELEEADTDWVKREQKVVNLSSKDAQQLGLTKCDDDIIRCIGRFGEDQPIILP